ESSTQVVAPQLPLPHVPLEPQSASLLQAFVVQRPPEQASFELVPQSDFELQLAGAVHLAPLQVVPLAHCVSPAQLDELHLAPLHELLAQAVSFAQLLDAHTAPVHDLLLPQVRSSPHDKLEQVAPLHEVLEQAVSLAQLLDAHVAPLHALLLPQVRS